MKAKIEAYLDSKRNLWQPSTFLPARSKIEYCALISPTFDPKLLFESLKSEGYGPYSIRVYLITYSQFELWLKGRSRIKQFLREHAYHFRSAYQERKTVMKKSDFDLLLSKAPSAEIHNALVLLGKCGLRKFEVFKAVWADLKDDEIEVLGKGNKLRQVPLKAEWLKEVHGSPLICGTRPGLQRFISESPFGFHDFRAFYATEVANNPELNLKDAALVLGHSSILTTERYVRSDFSRVKKALLR